jgi:hypothetical protein
VTLHADEGPQYRLQRIQFKNNVEVSNVTALRSLIPIEDGGIFNRTLIMQGMASLRKAYLEPGHLNFTSIPNTTINEESQTVSLDIDVDEGKKFFVSRIDIVGLDEPVFHNVIKIYYSSPVTSMTKGWLTCSSKSMLPCCLAMPCPIQISNCGWTNALERSQSGTTSGLAA